RALLELLAAGFKSAGPAVDADGSTYAQTQVRWTKGKEVQGVTATYGTGAKKSGYAVKASDTAGADVLVVVCRDWNRLQHHFARPRATTSVPPASSSTTTPAGPGSTATSTTTTSTTIPSYEQKYIPVDPKTGGVLVGCPKT